MTDLDTSTSLIRQNQFVKFVKEQEMLTALVLASVLQSKPQIDKTKPAIIYFTPAVTDLISTEIALNKGFSEANPLLQNRAVRISSRLISALVFYKLDLRYQKQGKNPKKFRIAVGLSMSSFTVWNATVIW